LIPVSCPLKISFQPYFGAPLIYLDAPIFLNSYSPPKPVKTQKKRKTTKNPNLSPVYFPNVPHGKDMAPIKRPRKDALGKVPQKRVKTVENGPRSFPLDQ